MPTPIAWTTAGAAILLRERSKAVTKPADTRDPVAALAASVDRFFNGDWEYAVRHGLAEQGYVLVNAEGLAAALDAYWSEDPEWDHDRVLAHDYAEGILAACLRAGEAEGQEPER